MNNTDLTASTANSEYLELKRLIAEKGLLNKTPLYYVHKLTVSLTLLGLSLALVAIIDNFGIVDHFQGLLQTAVLIPVFK